MALCPSRKIKYSSRMSLQDPLTAYRKQLQLVVTDPIAQGILTTLLQWKALLGLAILPTLLEIAREYITSSLTLSAGEFFLVTMLSVVGTAWLSAGVVMLAIECAQGKQSQLFHVSCKSLQFLPKVLLSYFIIYFFIFLSIVLAFQAVPALALLLFLIWSPAFCVGELYEVSKNTKKIPVKKKDKDIQELDRLDSAMDDPPPRFYFRYLSPWDLGFFRSVLLTGKHLATSAELVVLLWFAEVVPRALVNWCIGHPFSLSTRILQIVATVPGAVFVLGIWANSFLILLPKEARKEIGLTNFVGNTLPQWLRRLRPSSPSARLLPFMIALLLNAGATWYLYALLKEEGRIPEGIKTEIKSLEVADNELTLRFRLTDPSHRFRWLDPARFHLRFERKAVGTVQEKEKSPGHQQKQSTEQQNALFLTPERAYVYGEDGREIQLLALTPYFHPLLLVLSFPRPKELSAEVMAQGEETIELIYQSASGEEKSVFHGKASQFIR